VKLSDELDRCSPQPIDEIAGVGAHLLIIHGSQDELMLDQPTERLRDAAASVTKRYCQIEGADHMGLGFDNGAVRDCLERWWRSFVWKGPSK
jgi:hypothetical protein